MIYRRRPGPNQQSGPVARGIWWREILNVCSTNFTLPGFCLGFFLSYRYDCAYFGLFWWTICIFIFFKQYVYAWLDITDVNVDGRKEMEGIIFILIYSLIYDIMEAAVMYKLSFKNSTNVTCNFNQQKSHDWFENRNIREAFIGAPAILVLHLVTLNSSM